MIDKWLNTVKDYPGVVLNRVLFYAATNILTIEITADCLIPISFEQSLKTTIRESLPFLRGIYINIAYPGIQCPEEDKAKYVLERTLEPHLLERLNKQAHVRIEHNTLFIQFLDQGAFYQMSSMALEEAIIDAYQASFSQIIAVTLQAPEAPEMIDEEAVNDRLMAVLEESPTHRTERKKDQPVLKQKPTDADVVYKRKIKSDPVALSGFLEQETIVSIRGEVFAFDERILSTGKMLFSFAISDHTNAIKCKLFLDKKEYELAKVLKSGQFYLVEGRLRYDTYEKDIILNVMAINNTYQPTIRQDKSEEKRIELHAHTAMSAMDAVVSAKALIKRAIAWGHEAIAITDHGVIQAYPEAMQVAGKDIKVIYGLEGYLVNDTVRVIEDVKPYDLQDTFVVFDIETTGFSPKYDGITEIGAVKVQNGQLVDRYSTFVNPEKPIPDKVVELTGITDEMVRDARTIDAVLPEFLAFCGDMPIVAHNASFDMSFVIEKCKDNDLHFDPMVIDTLKLSRMLMKDLNRHKLNTVAKKLGIKLDNHHRAVDDAVATAHIFIKFVEMLKDQGVENTSQINSYGAKELDFKHFNNYHVILLVKNLKGLKNLYEMITHSHIESFYRKPLIPKSLLEQKREGLLIGTACEAGELYQSILSGADEAELLETASFYDYFEIQPIGNNQFLIEKGMVQSQDELRDHNKKIVSLAQQMDKPCVATSDCHFLDPEDEIYRRILMVGQGFSDAEQQPPLYFKTTEEMLDEFSYLGRDTARQVVIQGPHQINAMIEPIKPIPDGTYPPEIEGSDEELRTMCFDKAKRLYGDPIPEIVEKRLVRELDSIIGNGYAVMYIIAQKLVSKSLEDGYLVGSRGSVGSSFAATMSDITEVNPLPPHYLCKDCQYSEFITDGSIASGADLPDKTCPRCGIALKKDGHDIPFETFLGFEGDKEPDIDLNFAGVYQATSHAYTEELFGEGYVYKAGTIGTVAEKTAFGFVKKYFEEKESDINYYEVTRLSEGCTGVKRTSGQHPGGIMVVPHYKDVHDFTPIQYPANDASSGVKTTHFDYHSISGRILKLDILGHDVPTIIKMLEDFTGISAMDIPLDDRETLQIFTGTKSLKIKDPQYPITHGSLGIPEFGTKFVRKMLDDTKPTTFAELVQISGLSHGTDVWINNAQDLVQDGIVTLKDVIGTRDDIMVYLMYAGLPPKDAFFIMEGVRKGKGLKEEQEQQMISFNVPKWYIESCKKIKYMFPKAHAVAYVMMSVRIAHFKVHYPLAFYATFFSIKVDDFDAHLVSQGQNAILKQIQTLDALPKMSAKEQNQYVLLEVALEMYARGFSCLPVDLYLSDADQFMIKDQAILPPLRALQGVGENAARGIAEARQEREFMSIDDIKTRAKANRSVLEAMKDHGCLRGLPETNQLSFEMFLS